MMKKNYITPVINITEIFVKDIIAASGDFYDEQNAEHVYNVSGWLDSSDGSPT